MNNKNLRKNILEYFRKGKVIPCKYCNKICFWGKDQINDAVKYYNYSICYECFRKNSNCNLL